MLHVNYAYVLDSARRLRPDGKILDFGCGNAETVRSGLTQGLDIYGTDVFYGAQFDMRPKLKEDGLLDKRVFELIDGHKISFPDKSFDVVFSNQVIEHLDDIDGALAEMSRVLKDDGVMISLFPSKESLIEAHCRIPLAHRFDHDSKFGLAWIRTFRKMGMGSNHKDKTPDQWSRDFMEWIHQWCHYRSNDEAKQAYRRAGLSYERSEADYVKFRLNYTHKDWMVPLFGASPKLTSFAFSRLGGLVVVSKKLAPAHTQAVAA
jgi:ubiquinone/menaquinone biosynthesis C-methylase UbiE